MVPKYVAAASRTSATFPTALDSCSVIATLMLDNSNFPLSMIEGIGNFGEEIRGRWVLTTACELEDELDELDELNPP